MLSPGYIQFVTSSAIIRDGSKKNKKEKEKKKERKREAKCCDFSPNFCAQNRRKSSILIVELWLTFLPVFERSYLEEITPDV
jgi:hypothetical protein